MLSEEQRVISLLHGGTAYAARFNCCRNLTARFGALAHLTLRIDVARNKRTGVDVHIRQQATDLTEVEYGGAFRRIYPWTGVATPPWGAAFLTLDTASDSQPHLHDEDETFIFLEGNGYINVGDERSPVQKGDVVFLPRNVRHSVENPSPVQTLTFLCIWWGENVTHSSGASAAENPSRSPFF